jgi:hypothetical protein
MVCLIRKNSQYNTTSTRTSDHTRDFCGTRPSDQSFKQSQHLANGCLPKSHIVENTTLWIGARSIAHYDNEVIVSQSMSSILMTVW